MNSAVGFIIALAVGLTGIGGGSFTVPALLLLAGLTAGEAVGTAFLFAGVLRLIAAPFYLFGKKIHARYLWLLLQGAVPGLLLGIWLLRLLSRDAGKSCRNSAVGCSAGGVIQRDVHQARAKSFVRAEKPSLASLAGSADRSRVRIFIGRRWSSWNSAAAQLFRDDARASGGHGLAVWTCFGGHRRRFSLEFWLDQLADSRSASFGWHSGSSAGVLAGAESSGEQTEDGGCHGGYLRGTATCMERKPVASGKTRDEYREGHFGSRSGSCATANRTSRKKSSELSCRSTPQYLMLPSVPSFSSVLVVDPI